MAIFLHSVTVENFKAIGEAKIPLSSGLTVLVGQNSSGKSSALQAIHWACRCVAHPRIQKNQTRSLSVQEFDFYPTAHIKSVGNNKELRSRRRDVAEVAVKVSFEHSTEEDGEIQESTVKISKGNNQAVQIDLINDAVKDEFYDVLADKDRPFSSYIPGLAGIPLVEEKRSRLPITRQAASGDANTVLRNILLLIKEDKRENVSLEKLSELCSTVLGATKIEVKFDEVRDAEITATIRTASMSDGHWTPLEMAGTGVLQCIQIFAYIILYRPYLLLMDEPDAHLHPDRQEKLVAALSNSAKDYGMSIVMTTHSPNVVRAMPSSAEIVWMSEGRVQNIDASEIRRKMGWGILDKKILLITEDGEPTELKEIISQWPHLERAITVWPVSGNKSLPNPLACVSLIEMTGVSGVVIHRDGDFMTPLEKGKYRAKYGDNRIAVWITDDADVEALFLSPQRIASKHDLEIRVIDELYKKILHDQSIDFENVFSDKRREITEDRRLWDGRDAATKLGDAKQDIPKGVNGLGHVHGKLFSKFLKNELNALGKKPKDFFSIKEGDQEIGVSLKLTLEGLMRLVSPEVLA